MVKEHKKHSNARTQESYVSLILGFLIVVVSGILFYTFITNRNASGSVIQMPTPTITEELDATTSATIDPTRQQLTITPLASPTPSPKPSSSPTPTARPTASAVPRSATATPTIPVASVTPAPVQQQGGAGTHHTVQKGESLWKVSQTYYGTGIQWRKIAVANDITDPRNVPAGQTLKIPDAVEKGPSISATATQLPTQYTVVAGDSLWKISIAHYGTGFEWVYIARVNNIQSPGIIYPGTVLQLPRPHATLDPPGGAKNPPKNEKK